MADHLSERDDLTAPASRLHGKIDACLERHSRALAPASPLTRVMTMLGGGAIGEAAVSAARGHVLVALVSLAVAVVLLIPMAVRVIRRVRFRRDLARIRKEIRRG